MRATRQGLCDLRRPAKWALWLVFLALLGLGDSPCAHAAPLSRVAATGTPSSQGDVSSLRVELQGQRVKVAVLEQQVKSVDAAVSVVQAYMLWLVFGGFAIGVWGFFRSERRVGQLHELVVAGETATQGRTEQVHATLLDASQKTLDLVNDTLSLAKEASSQAAETIRKKATDSLAEVDTEATNLLERIRARGNLKGAIEHSEIRKSVLATAAKLATREGYIQAQDVKLTAPCYFVKAIQAYDEGQSRVAEEYFHQAAATQNRDARTQSLFWCGYVSNNMGKFDEALELFTRARHAQPSDSEWYVDIGRVLAETRFFADAQRLHATGEDRRPDSVEAVVSNLRAELDPLTPALKAAIMPEDRRQKLGRKMKLLLANTLFWAHACVGDTEYRDDAIAAYQDARDEEGIWANFGLAVSMDLRGDVVRDEAWEALDKMCEGELESRGEPRHLALLTLTRLQVASRRRSQGQKAEGLMTQLLDHLRAIDDLDWLYSQNEKRNVDRGTFLEEAKQALRGSQKGARRKERGK